MPSIGEMTVWTFLALVGLGVAALIVSCVMCLVVMSRLHATYMRCINDVAKVNNYMRSLSLSGPRPALGPREVGARRPPPPVEEVLRRTGATNPGAVFRESPGE